MIYFYVDRSIKDNRPLDQEFFNSAGVKMLKVEPGTFMMGSPEGETEREEQEGPQREVTLTQPFYMSQTEITRKQYLEVVSNVPGLLKVQVTGKVRQSMPVEGISYDEAVEYCKKLTLKESKTDRHRPGWEYRLPTEAEWEYVARAGSETPFARFEDGGTGDTITMIKHAVFDFNIDDPYMQLPPDFKAKTRMPYPAFSSQEEATSLNFADKYRHPNRWGFYDMHGNVYEWVRDFYSEKYPEGPATDPTGPATGTYRVIRGGAWTEPAGKCRSAAREGREASTKSSDIGFRIVYAKKPENP
jgi:formylglycine-generating enzyme required for sulfatase activity